MRIDNFYLSGLQGGALRGNQETGEAGRKGEVGSSKPPVANLHVPSPEIGQLRQLVQAVPDTRPDEIARVATLLAAGHYASAAAAQQTADAIIQANE
jgi:hypothetical protein